MPTRYSASDAVRLRTLPTQLAGLLVRRIVDGDLDNDRAPSELDISRKFGVSRVVARETLKILASLDMVEIAQGRRVTIRPAAEWDYLSPLLMEWLPQEQCHDLLIELQEMRLIFEPELAARAAAVMNDETLRGIKAELDRMMELEDEPDHYLEADQEFHMKICKAAHNRIFDRIMYASRWLLAASRRYTNEVPGSLRRATAAHRKIFAALEARDPDAARAAMRDHVKGSAAVWLGVKKQTATRA